MATGKAHVTRDAGRDGGWDGGNVDGESHLTSVPRTVGGLRCRTAATIAQSTAQIAVANLTVGGLVSLAGVVRNGCPSGCHVWKRKPSLPALWRRVSCRSVWIPMNINDCTWTPFACYLFESCGSRWLQHVSNNFI